MSTDSDIGKLSSLVQTILGKAAQRLGAAFSFTPQPVEAKNAIGEIVNTIDLDLQKFIVDELAKLSPEAIFVGEEAIGEGCLTEFPSAMDKTRFYWVVDPIDGSANFQKGVRRLGITIGRQTGPMPHFGIVYVTLQETPSAELKEWFITGHNGIAPTISDGTKIEPKPYDRNSLSLLFGLGKRKPQDERDRFEAIVLSLAYKTERPGCASYSILQVLTGKHDAYLSLKEVWTNIAPWYAILQNSGFYHNLDQTLMNSNKPFCMVVATHEFANNHLQPGSDLATCLEN